MKKIKIKYIKEVTYYDLRNLILDEELTENHTIILGEKIFDDIVLEYRRLYNESMTVPHLILGVLIREPKNGERISPIGIGILESNEVLNLEVVYKCRWCGTIVDIDGNKIFGQMRTDIINILKNRDIPTKKVKGVCCLHEYDSY